MIMGIREDKSTIEAALYAADRPLSLDELRRIIGTSSETYTRKLLDALEVEYRKRKGSLELSETAKNIFSLRLQEEYIPRLEGIVPKTKLTRGALKTLAMIAYRQPISQAKLAQLRGSRVYEYVKKLLDLGFIEARSLGRTRILRTSKKFASYFGFEDDMDKIRERLQQMMK